MLKYLRKKKECIVIRIFYLINYYYLPDIFLFILIILIKYPLLAVSMGRPRLDRRVVTHSLAKDTVDRIDLLREHEQNRAQQRTTRVTLSEIIDAAVRLLDRKTFMDDDPTHGGRFFVAWTGTEEWSCPSCVESNYNEGEAPSLTGGWIICPYVKCGKPRPTASYPEPLPDGWKIQEACIPCGTGAKVVEVEAGLRDY